MASVKITHVIS